MKQVLCRKTRHGRFMNTECLDCDSVHDCDREALENKNLFDDIGVNQI